MQTFTYTARDPKSGKKIKAEVQAETQNAAAKALRIQGLAPLTINVKGGSGILGAKSKVRTKDKIIFSRQLSTLINAGLPLTQSLRSVADQTASKPMQTVIQAVINSVESGRSFADSLKAHPKVFDNIFVSLVAAGEVSGTLDGALERIAMQQEKDAEIISKVRGAMAYPVIVMFVMLAVVTFMIVSVLPQVKNIYDGIPGVKLPFITQFLLTISNFVIGYWWIFIILAILGGVFMTRWAQSGGGRIFFDKIKLNMPPVNRLFVKVYMARFARTVATSINNTELTKIVNDAADKVKGGKSLADSLQGQKYFLPLVPNMIRTGEQSGSLQTMMLKTADYYEKEVDNEIKTVSTIIEPMLMVILGVVAITIVAAILLPIYSLVGKSIIK
jgi:type IV pilus assembly protein PilC